MIYHDRPWSLYPGGAALERLVRAAAADGTLVPRRTFDLPLMFERLRGREGPARVIVYEVARTSRRQELATDPLSR